MSINVNTVSDSNNEGELPIKHIPETENAYADRCFDEALDFAQRFNKSRALEEEDSSGS